MANICIVPYSLKISFQTFSSLRWEKRQFDTFWKPQNDNLMQGEKVKYTARSPPWKLYIVAWRALFYWCGILFFAHDPW